ncbi:PREDICTED: 28S ribosomal protein S15, mitochondrial [Polistes dominula]|uniref:Small ribosomal subunit protein uS15m n=1 Tax=Polistes dominula TaxID=743375 RepID=A0ABM1IM96_POLDO|nr:PREDICTED: 28S ribosomal protein S15, mitochondrial [Polistes dominula]
MNSLVNCCKNLSKTTINRITNQYFVKEYGTHLSDYNIKWVRPTVIPKSKPEKSGDLGIPHDVKPTQLVPGYEKSKELQDANEIVRRLVTLQFYPRKETIKTRSEKIIELVKRHGSDRGSPEVMIAAMTAEILQLQENAVNNIRDKREKVFLRELIDKRNKYLRKMRKWDYKRYEWILERLNLFYKALPTDNTPAYRKDSLRKLTQKHCDKIKQAKLDAYKAQLKQEQKTFFKDKVEKLIFIRKEELELGLEPTVTEDDIERARGQLNEVLNEQTS